MAHLRSMDTLLPPGVAEIDLAEAATCAAACREIYAQRPLWRARRLFDQRPFYTLGAASYLDLGFAVAESRYLLPRLPAS